MPSFVEEKKPDNNSVGNGRSFTDKENNETFDDADGNLIYDKAEEEPQIHARTFVALAAMFLLNLVQVFALQGPPAVLPFIAASVDATETQTWIPNSLSLVQAVLGPVIASASDTFQARKIVLVSTCTISFIGAAIAPGSQSVGRLIAAQTLIGVGFASVPLAYCVPSEILPRKWRPAIQGIMNIAANSGAVAGILSISALTRDDPQNGWRKYYWIQMAMWGLTALGLLFGYRPPKRHTRLDHMTLWQKIKQLDLVGFFLLTAGLALFLAGLNLGGVQYPWSSGRVLGTLITGIVVLMGFGFYEWKGTSTGILQHDLFRNDEGRGRAFAICVVLIFIEGILLFSVLIYYPQLTANLFSTNPFLQGLRSQPAWIAALLTSALYGYSSTHFRSIRTPLSIGFLFFTASTIGLATIQPGASTNALIFDGLFGIGFGSPLVLITAAVQLAVPHHLIATATAVITSARAVAASVFTAGYAAALNNRAQRLVPRDVGPAVLGAGLPRGSLEAFIAALSARNQTALGAVPGVSPAIIDAGMTALKQAMADSIRVVYIIAAPFGVVAIVACFFLGDLSRVMNYRVDAPVERLRAKHDRR